MNNDFYNSVSQLDSKNNKLKSLFNLPGFNYENKPIKITDNLNINNHIKYFDKVIDEKIFIKFFGKITNSENKKYGNKTTKKNKPRKNNKQTKKSFNP